jgi:hypothetical protein
MSTITGALTPLVKTVHRGAQVFDETYWVKTEAVRANVDKMHQVGALSNKQYPVFSEAVKELGGDGRKAADWAESFAWGQNAASASHARSVEIDPDHPEKQEVVAQGSAKGLQDIRQAARDTAAGKPDATLSAIATLSQAMYKEPTVEVYRGLYGKKAQAVIDQIREHGNAEVSLRELTSFSEKIWTAEGFAEGVGSGENYDSSKPHLVIRVQVPRESIAMSWRAVPSLDFMSEKEVTVLTGGSVTIKKDDAWAYDFVPSKGEKTNKPDWAEAAEKAADKLPMNAGGVNVSGKVDPNG